MCQPEGSSPDVRMVNSVDAPTKTRTDAFSWGRQMRSRRNRSFCSDEVFCMRNVKRTRDNRFDAGGMVAVAVVVVVVVVVPSPLHRFR